MARTFNGSNQRLYTTAFDDFAGATKAALAGFVKRPSAGSIVYFGGSKRWADWAFGIVFWSDGKIYVACGNGDVTSYGDFGTNNDTDWHHIVADFDGTLSGNANRLKVFVDGSQVTADGFGAAGIDVAISASNSGAFEIGARQITSANQVWGTGAIALVGAWVGRTLGGTAAANLYIGSSAIEDYDTGLVGHWKMDETSGNAADSSASGYTLTAENNPGFEADPVGGGGGGAPVVVPYRRTMVVPPPGNWARFHRGV